MAESSPDLVAVLREGAAQVNDQMTQPDSDWEPVLVVKSPRGIGLARVIICADKQSSAMSIATSLREWGATEAALLTSSWAVVRGGDFDPSTDLPISKQPDRKEFLVLTHVTRDSAEMSMAEIHRAPDRAPVLGPWEDHGGGPFLEGIFVDAMRAGIG